MLDPGTYALFCAAALALIVVPGPAVLYIVAQSVQGGREVGLAAAAGVAAGGIAHVAAAVIGLSALVVASAEAFTVVKLAGAAYLVALGIATLLRRGGQLGAEARGPRGAPSAFRRGAVVNVLNPKTAVFFLAFLPQFVDPDGPVRLQLAVLGATFVALALVSDSLWALAAGTAGGWLRRHRAYGAVRRWLSGAIYLGLGVAAAVSGPHRPT
jgi:threonine/homoserine/homoserine lactone efflux protein